MHIGFRALSLPSTQTKTKSWRQNSDRLSDSSCIVILIQSVLFLLSLIFVLSCQMLLFFWAARLPWQNCNTSIISQYVQSFIHPPILPAGEKKINIIMAVLCYQSTCAESLSTLRLLLLQDLRMLNLSAETNMGFFPHYRLCDHKTEAGAVSRKWRKADAAKQTRWCWSIASNSNKIDPCGKLHWSEKRRCQK